jgi:hypothetical protein
MHAIAAGIRTLAELKWSSPEKESENKLRGPQMISSSFDIFTGFLFFHE